jgi:hypothetical protein
LVCRKEKAVLGQEAKAPIRGEKAAPVHGPPEGRCWYFRSYASQGHAKEREGDREWETIAIRERDLLPQAHSQRDTGRDRDGQNRGTVRTGTPFLRSPYPDETRTPRKQRERERKREREEKMYVVGYADAAMMVPFAALRTLYHQLSVVLWCLSVTQRDLARFYSVEQTV